LVVDKDGYIVFSNLAFARKTGLTPNQLVGQKSTELDWEIEAVAQESNELPWFRLLAGQTCPTGVRVRLTTALKATYTVTANVSPITAAADKIKGALITFDDITAIETKNEELRRTLGKLEKSQREITRQNQELQVLATRDPLTGSLNRRSLFQGFETLFTEAQEEGGELSCIMVDIDHFKSVNDRFGHAVGDKVIKLLAKILTEHSRPIDLVGRFGGEEFCVVLPEVGTAVAAEIAERMRLAVQEGKEAKFTSTLRITASFGVAALSERVNDHNAMLEQADKALYAAKEGGRNRVVKWSIALEEEAPAGVSGTTEPAPAATEPAPAADAKAPPPPAEDASPAGAIVAFPQPAPAQSRESAAKVVKLHPQDSGVPGVAHLNDAVQT
ncbi:MAG: sensor domain-containing diguanylate cyclase, partial [bacterium]|nr:sensor domain-containing diguanylate cyclase [bacterium]